MMNLVELFQPSLRDAADRVALEFTGHEYSFGELDRRSNRVANFLVSEGLQSGDRIAVYMHNCCELIDVYLASVKLGLMFTPINILYRDREIEHIVRDAEPRLLLREVPDAVGTFADTFEPQRTDWNTPMCLVYTSGTTGRPKGAILTHGNLIANAQNLIDAWRITAEDRLLLSLPLFHVHGLGNGLHTWLATGYRMRLLERFRKEAIFEEFLSFRPTLFFGVPTMYERLLAVEPDVAREIGNWMRLFVSGSAPLPAQTFARFQELYGHAILERYGMTETLMNISNPYEGERRPGTVGKPMPGVVVRIEDGQVLVKGPNVFPGYWRNPEATAAAFSEDGSFRTGDLGICSDDGYYTLQGRRTELIINAGFNVYPREIEEFLREQPGIADAAVVGVPDPVKGEVPVAFVVLDEGRELDATSLDDACRSQMASFKVPVRFECVAQLPRNALGKVQRHLLGVQ